jgi:hypothetical protein
VSLADVSAAPQAFRRFVTFKKQRFAENENGLWINRDIAPRKSKNTNKKALSDINPTALSFGH